MKSLIIAFWYLSFAVLLAAAVYAFAQFQAGQELANSPYSVYLRKWSPDAFFAMCIGASAVVSLLLLGAEDFLRRRYGRGHAAVVVARTWMRTLGACLNLALALAIGAIVFGGMEGFEAVDFRWWLYGSLVLVVVPLLVFPVVVVRLRRLV